MNGQNVVETSHAGGSIGSENCVERESRPDRIASSKLRPHPKNVEIMRPATPAEDRELSDNIKEHGVERPLVVTDESCASGYGVVLGGCRRWHFAVTQDLMVPVTWVSNLSAAEEENRIVQDNLLAQLARRLTEEDLARAENYIWCREEKGAGYRSDLANPSNVTSGEVARGLSIRQIVAKAVKRNESQVRYRHALYYDAVSPSALKDAVTAGKISLSRGYQLIVDARRAFSVPAESLKTASEAEGTELAEDPAINEARADIALKVATALGTKPPKSKSGPRMPKVLPRASFRLSDGAQKVPLGHRTILAIPRGETVDICETAGSAQPAPGGSHEQRKLTLENSLEAVRNVIGEFPHEFTEGMQIVDVEVTDPRLVHQARIVITGDPELPTGEVCLSWWHSEKDWWCDNPPDIRVKSKPAIPAVHIEGKLSRKDELIYFEGKHPFNTVSMLMSSLQKIIMHELGPVCGVRAVDNTWVDRDGAKIILPKYRAGTPWNPTTPINIACPVTVEPYEEIARLAVHTPDSDDLTVFGYLLDFDRLRQTGRYPQFLQLPPEGYGYPFRDGFALSSLLLGRRASEAAVLARASGFAIRPPDFLDTERPALANTWFLAVFAFDSGTESKVILVDVGWTDDRGVSRGVLTPMPAMRGTVKCAAFHRVSDIGLGGEPHPVQLLIDMRFLAEENNHSRESLPIAGTAYEHREILDDP